MSARNVIKKIAPKLLTLSLVVAAGIAASMLYVRYTDQPWTRDAQVRADVIKIVPRVSGYLMNINVKDNQFVKAGEVLFQIDRVPYQLAVDEAQVALDQAREEVTALEAAVQVAEAMVDQQEAAVTSARGKVSEMQAGVDSATAVIKESESGVASATALIAQVEALLEESKREAERAKRLADKKAGSVETAEAKAAAVLAYQAEGEGADAGLVQSHATVEKSKAALSQAEAKLQTAQNGVTEAEASLAAANADLDQAKANLGEPGEANVAIRTSKVKLEQAKLNLSWTTIVAPVDGYITNLSLINSTFVSPGTPFALLVDSSTFRVDAYFQETKLKHIQPGDRTLITLMGYDQKIEGEVESIGYAINPPDIAQTEAPENLVPSIQPSFDWIRLAQRVPVRIQFNELPENVHLVSGMTASISIQE